MKTATAQLQTASGEVINQQDQYEVFNDPRAVSSNDRLLDARRLRRPYLQSDPTHSFLSKDHFVCIQCWPRFQQLTRCSRISFSTNLQEIWEKLSWYVLNKLHYHVSQLDCCARNMQSIWL